MTFEKFINRVVINAKLVAVTPIFVGARSDSLKPGAINGSCVKDASGRPYIPGSSLKGILRAFLASVKDEPTESAAEIKYGKKEQRDEIVTKYKADKNPGNEDRVDELRIIAEKIHGCSTKVECLFGSKLMAGKIKIADAVPVDADIALEVRNGVAIDRDTHTASGGALFDTEVVPSGTEFMFNLSAENLNTEEGGEAELFGELMEYFAQGNITVGGRSRAGLGSVELRDVVVEVYTKNGDGFPAKKSLKCDNSGIKKAVCGCLNS